MVQVELRASTSTLRLPSSVEPLLGVERDELDLLRIVEDRRRDGAAEVDVEARPVALVVLGREAGQPGVDAAVHGVAPHRPLQRLGVVALVGDGGGRDRDRDRRSRSGDRCENSARKTCACSSPTRIETAPGSAGRSDFRPLPDDHLGADRNPIVEIDHVADWSGGSSRTTPRCRWSAAGWCRGCDRPWRRDTSRARRADCPARRPSSAADRAGAGSFPRAASSPAIPACGVILTRPCHWKPSRPTPMP